MKLRTLNDLQDYLDSEHVWRLKEISDLKEVIRKSEVHHRDTVIRAGIPLLYAHWEGFVKKAAEAYINYVACSRLSYEEVSSNFIALGVKKRLQELTESGNIRQNIETVDFFRTEMKKRVNLSSAMKVNTRSNLSSIVFKNIIGMIGVDASKYETRYNWIDTSLVDKRNHIAHGNYIGFSAENFRSLADDVILLLRSVKTDIENSASAESYKYKPLSLSGIVS